MAALFLRRDKIPVICNSMGKMSTIWRTLERKEAFGFYLILVLYYFVKISAPTRRSIISMFYVAYCVLWYVLMVEVIIISSRSWLLVSWLYSALPVVYGWAIRWGWKHCTIERKSYSTGTSSCASSPGKVLAEIFLVSVAPILYFCPRLRGIFAFFSQGTSFRAVRVPVVFQAHLPLLFAE